MTSTSLITRSINENIKDLYPPEKSLLKSLNSVPDQDSRQDYNESKKNSSEKILRNLILALENIIAAEQQSLDISDLIEESEHNCFNTFNEKKIPLKEYLKRIRKYLNPEISSFVICLVLLDRLISYKKQNIRLTRDNIHKLFVVSLLLSLKFNEDDHFDNQYFSKVAGMSLSELNFLELKYCEMINFNLFIPPKLYDHYYKYLKSYSDR